jgi:hypothetical protein
LLVTIATTVVGVMRMREAGEALPWEDNRDAESPA